MEKITYLCNKYCDPEANKRNKTQLLNIKLRLISCKRMNTTMKLSGMRKKFIIVDRALNVI